MKILCFDVGGTATKYGIIDDSGNPSSTGAFPTPKLNCRRTIPESIISQTEQLESSHKFDCIGISTAGQVNNRDGSIIYANENLPDFTGCRLSDIISGKTGYKVFVENDANCAVIGELWKGAGRGYGYFICLTLGTGVGGAVVVDRKLMLGAHNVSGEFGRISSRSGILANETIFDRTASTKSLLDRYESLTGQSIDGRILMDKVRSGEAIAATVWNDCLESLTEGLANLTFVFDPEAIIIGGGISAQGDFFFDKVNELYNGKVMSAHKSIKIIKAELENSAGLLGAAYICLDRKYFL